MESARKASEIHKKRTGKPLRITEDDVRNEEMYQEIDEPEETRESRRHGETSKRQGGSAKK